MVGWHHRINGHEFEQAPRVKDRKTGHAAVHGITKSQTQLSNCTTEMQFPEGFLPLEDKNTDRS